MPRTPTCRWHRPPTRYGVDGAAATASRPVTSTCRRPAVPRGAAALLHVRPRTRRDRRDMEHFDPEAVPRIIERHQVTHSRSCRPCSCACSSSTGRAQAPYDVSSLQCVVHAAAPCPIAGEGADDRVVRRSIHEYYAGTEGNGFVILQQRDWLAHEGSVGTPLPARCTSSTTTAASGPPASRARSTSRAVATFEYHNDAEKTRAGADPTRASTLGDVGYLDDDGYLYLTDRKAYMIISGGVNIYPQEAENVLVTHPSRRRRSLRRAQRRLRRGGQGRRAPGRPCRPTQQRRRHSSRS